MKHGPLSQKYNCTAAQDMRNMVFQKQRNTNTTHIGTLDGMRIIDSIVCTACYIGSGTVTTVLLAYIHIYIYVHIYIYIDRCMRKRMHIEHEHTDAHPKLANRQQATAPRHSQEAGGGRRNKKEKTKTQRAEKTRTGVSTLSFFGDDDDFTGPGPALAQTLNPKPQTPNPKPQTLNPEPRTPNLKPKVWLACFVLGSV